MTPILPQVSEICQSVVLEYANMPSMLGTTEAAEKVKIQAALEKLIVDLRQKDLARHLLKICLRNLIKLMLNNTTQLDYYDIAGEENAANIKAEFNKMLDTINELVPIEKLANKKQVLFMLIECLLQTTMQDSKTEKFAQFNLEQGRAFLAKHFSEKDNPTSFSELLLTLKLMTEYGGSEHLENCFQDLSSIPTNETGPNLWPTALRRKLSTLDIGRSGLLSANFLFVLMREMNYFASAENKAKCAAFLQELKTTKLYTFSAQQIYQSILDFIFSTRFLTMIICPVVLIFFLALKLL